MASKQILQLFKAIYDGNLSVVKSLHQDGLDLAESSFVIETDEVCLCGTAFENLGLEFTALASPTRDKNPQRQFESKIFRSGGSQVKLLDLSCDNISKIDSGGDNKEQDSKDKETDETKACEESVTDTPTVTLTDTENGGVTTPLTEKAMTSSVMSSSFMSDGRRVYEPPLWHWLEQGRCSHICEQNDLDFDYLEDLEELQDEGDDLDKDLDLAVYGIRLSPNPLTEDGMSVSISSDINDRLRSLQMSDSIEETCEESTANSDDDSPSLNSSGPSVNINADLFAYLQKHYSDEDSLVVQTPVSKLPHIHDFDSLGSDTGSGVLVGSIKVASVSPLHVAAARGHDEVVRFLLDNGLEANALTSDTKETPLHLACRWGKCEVVKTLLKHSADPVITSAVDCSPMHVAIELSCSICLAAMLEKLPEEETLDVRVKETLLVYAVVRDNVTLLGSLLDKFKTNVKEALVVEPGHTYLQKAAAAGAVRCVHLLADRGTSLDATNPEGETALHMAASCGHLGAVQALLQAGAVPTTSANWLIGDNQTPLMLAAYHNCPEVVQALLPYDDVNCQSECGDTALHYCAFRGCLDGVESLISAGANVNLRNQYGATALWNGSCYLDIIKLLIKSGATTKVKSVGHDLDHLRGAVYDTPRNPLEITLEEGFFETSIVLLQAGCTLPRMRALQLLDQGHARYDLDKNLYESVRKCICCVVPLKILCRRRIVKSLEKHDDSIRNILVEKLPVIDDELKAYLCFSDL